MKSLILVALSLLAVSVVAAPMTGAICTATECAYAEEWSPRTSLSNCSGSSPGDNYDCYDLWEKGACEATGLSSPIMVPVYGVCTVIGNEERECHFWPGQDCGFDWHKEFHWKIEGTYCHIVTADAVYISTASDTAFGYCD